MSDTASSHFIEAAVGLVPQIRSCAEEIEELRRLPLPLVEAIARGRTVSLMDSPFARGRRNRPDDPRSCRRGGLPSRQWGRLVPGDRRDIWRVRRLHKVAFIVADLGADTDPFMLHLYAALAEKERRMISQRTKDALAAAKANGKQLGGSRDHGRELKQAAIKRAKALRRCSMSWPVSQRVRSPAS